ncbi:unnamed protein product [Parnassius apollo]|uniref:(apollo) hypothetical protein n=1 Tax=Parnassius apollo TaxID=110799 RepID=A0A8S3WQ25_PARAO|nr:unnamed protein product [Parnassius apollo]
MCLATLLFFEAKSTDLKLSNDFYNYGPYDLVCSKYEVCIDSRVSNLTSSSTKLIKEGNNYFAWLNSTFFAQTRVDEKLNNPCKHYAIADIIEKFYDAENCVVKQGNYRTMLNFTEVSNSYFGSSFFYGEYKMKSTVYSKKRSILCVFLNVVFTKKKALYDRN